jgi:hypothetical protein
VRTSNLPINQDRLWDDLMVLAEITEKDKPYTRRSFTPTFLQGRDWLKARFEAAGLDTRIDAGGNLVRSGERARSWSDRTRTPYHPEDGSMGRLACLLGLRWLALCKKRDTISITTSKSSIVLPRR